ncbi:MAG: RNA polymerase sigma factor [Minisyncoccia bacterium]
MDSDEKIIEEYLDGRRDTLDDLVRKHTNHIYNFIRQYVRDEKRAEDLTQDVFLKVWKNLDKFDPAMNFTSWLFRIARNTVIDFLRKKKSVNFSELKNNDEEGEIEVDFPDNEPLPEELYEEKELQTAVAEILSELPEKYRSVLVLYHQNQLNFREISEVSGDSVNTVKSRYRRALDIVRKNLADNKNAPKTNLYA